MTNPNALLRFTARALLLASICLTHPPSLTAQTDGPPKVLVITREDTKPGKGGDLHEKSESAFIRLLAAAKVRYHFYAMNSLTGNPRALFFAGFDSLADWEAQFKPLYADPKLSSALDREAVLDGDLLSASTTSVWSLRSGLSHNPGTVAGARYIEVTRLIIRPGHQPDWEELAKLVGEGYRKGMPDIDWVMYEQTYGSAGTSFLILTQMKSLAEVDHHFTEGKGFAEALGEEKLKTMSSLEAACIESEETNLFILNPKMSYPSEALIKSDPAFWTPPRSSPKTSTPAKKPAP